MPCQHPRLSARSRGCPGWISQLPARGAIVVGICILNLCLALMSLVIASRTVAVLKKVNVFRRDTCMHSVSGQRLIEPKSLNLVYSYCDEPWADVGYLPGKSGNPSPFGSLHQWPDEGKKAWECGAQGLDEPF